MSVSTPAVQAEIDLNGKWGNRLTMFIPMVKLTRAGI